MEFFLVFKMKQLLRTMRLFSYILSVFLTICSPKQDFLLAKKQLPRTMLLKAFVDRSMFLRNLPIVAPQHLKRSVGEMLLGLLSITNVSQYRQSCTVIFVLKSLVCFHHYTVRQVFTYSFEFSRSLVYPLLVQKFFSNLQIFPSSFVSFLN